MGKAAYFSYVITLLLIWLEGGFIQAQSCDRGKHWSPEKQTCEKCPVGTYQDYLQDYVPSECKRCPDSTTTFIEGATLKSYCRVDCLLGKEYNFRYHNCSLCPVGEFRNEAVQFCYVCPYGHTTVNSGSSACIKTNSNPPLIQKLNITIALSFNLGPCENINHVTNTVQQNVLFLMRRQRARYPDLCASDNCDNIRVTIQSVCNVSDGARAQIDVININDFLFDNKVEHYRNTLSVLLEAFYDMTIIQDTLANPPICDTGQILKLDGECESCQPGQFANGFQCRNCAKNEYSAKPVNNFCVKCPPNTKTEKEGSSNSSDCKEDDKTVIIAASTSGAVVLCAVIVIVAVVCWRGCKSRETNMDARQAMESPENQTEYDLPSIENSDTASQHSYINPGVIPDNVTPDFVTPDNTLNEGVILDYFTSDYITPDNTLNEEEIYKEIP